MSVGFDVTGTGAMSFQVGAAAADAISVAIADVRSTALGLAAPVDMAANAINAGTALDQAIQSLNSSAPTWVP